MRKVIGYTETGAKIWRDEGPSAASMAGHRGSLVTGESRPAKGAGLTACQMHPESVRKPRARMGRPRLSPDVELHPRGKVYATEEERIAARRQSWRQTAQRRRDRRAAEKAA